MRNSQLAHDYHSGRHFLIIEDFQSESQDRKPFSMTMYKVHKTGQIPVTNDLRVSGKMNFASRNKFAKGEHILSLEVDSPKSLLLESAE